MNPHFAKSIYSTFKPKPFRPGQKAAIDFITNSDRKYRVLCAPCGAGKSLVGACCGAYYDRFSYLCSSKYLQDQIQFDFPEVEVMKGRSNYMCSLFPGKTADRCIHSKQTPCEYKGSCEYEVQKRKVLVHPRQVMNYWYALSEWNYIGRFVKDQYPFVICDEVDLLESILVSFISLRIPKRMLTMLDLKPPKYKTAEAKMGVESWKIWADTARDVVGSRLLKMETEIDDIKGSEQMTSDQEAVLYEYQAMDSLHSSLGIFLEYVDDTWIFDMRPRSWMFRPVWLTPELTEKYLFQYSDRFLLMSATVPAPNVLGILLGISPSDIDYMELPSLWPVDNRKVYLNPVGDLGYKTIDSDLPKILDRIVNILGDHKHEKGVIHTTSYKVTKAVMSIGDRRLVTHDTHDRHQVISAFKNSQEPLVLVSPSSTRGLSLEGDKCRFVIFSKAPYLNLKDKLVNRRLHGSYLGQQWYRAMCADDILQGSYRAIRSEDDWCVTYCLDKQITNLIVDNQKYFPRYFLEAVEIV